MHHVGREELAHARWKSRRLLAVVSLVLRIVGEINCSQCTRTRNLRNNNKTKKYPGQQDNSNRKSTWPQLIALGYQRGKRRFAFFNGFWKNSLFMRCFLNMQFLDLCIYLFVSFFINLILFILLFLVLKIFQRFRLNFLIQNARTLGGRVDKRHLLNGSRVIFENQSIPVRRSNTSFAQGNRKWIRLFEVRVVICPIFQIWSKLDCFLLCSYT